jgi:hypothetical protein
MHVSIGCNEMSIGAEFVPPLNRVLMIFRYHQRKILAIDLSQKAEEGEQEGL